MFKTFKPVAGLTLALVAGLANATDISFGSLSAKQSSTSYDENSYLITPTFADDLLGVKTGAGKVLETSGFTFVSSGATAGNVFDLNSFIMDFGNATDVTLTYTVAGVAGSTMIDLKDKADDTYKFTGLDDLTSFTLEGTTTTTTRRHGTVTTPEEFVIDDIKVSPYSSTVSVVPEPSSMALMFAGLGIFATLVRRRRV